MIQRMNFKIILSYVVSITFCSEYSGGGSSLVGIVDIEAGKERSINKGSS
ncbi:unnamed protein product, partial [Rotaria sp. Silwood1]